MVYFMEPPKVTWIIHGWRKSGYPDFQTPPFEPYLFIKPRIINTLLTHWTHVSLPEGKHFGETKTSRKKKKRRSTYALGQRNAPRLHREAPLKKDILKRQLELLMGKRSRYSWVFWVYYDIYILYHAGPKIIMQVAFFVTFIPPVSTWQWKLFNLQMITDDLASYRLSWLVHEFPSLACLAGEAG